MERNPDTAPLAVRIARNAWEPITVPRWVFTVKYIMFVIVGLVAFFSGVPSLDTTTFHGYEPIWALSVAVGAFVAVFGSLASSPKHEIVESIGSTIVVSFLIVLIIGVFMRDNPAVALLLGIVTLLPAIRTSYLLRRWAVKYRKLR